MDTVISLLTGLSDSQVRAFRHGKGIITTVLKGIKRKNNILSMIYDIQFDFFFPPTGKGTFFFSKYMWTDTKRYMMAFSFWFVLIYPN